jgi:PEP-CTERM motif
VPGANFSGGGPGTFEGVDYTHTFLAGDFSFTGPTFSSAILSPSNLTITAPFAMTATLQNFSSNPLTNTDPPLFTASLFGSGTATARFTAVPNGDGQGHTLFDVSNLTFQFEPAAATPEPASLVLLATGVLGLAARRRAR